MLKSKINHTFSIFSYLINLINLYLNYMGSSLVECCAPALKTNEIDTDDEFF